MQASAGECRQAPALIEDHECLGEPGLQRVKQAVPRDPGGAFSEMGRRLVEPLRRMRHIDAHADDDARSPVRVHLALQQDARELGPIKQHVIRPFERETRGKIGRERGRNRLDKGHAGHETDQRNFAAARGCKRKRGIEIAGRRNPAPLMPPPPELCSSATIQSRSAPARSASFAAELVEPISGSWRSA